MEIRLGGDMRQRPVCFFAVHRFEHDTQAKAGGLSRQEKAGDDRFEPDIVRRRRATNLRRCPGSRNDDPRERLKSPDVAPRPSEWPDLKLGVETARLNPNEACPPPVAVNP